MRRSYDFIGFCAFCVRFSVLPARAASTSTDALHEPTHTGTRLFHSDEAVEDADYYTITDSVQEPTHTGGGSFRSDEAGKDHAEYDVHEGDTGRSMPLPHEDALFLETRAYYHPRRRGAEYKLEAAGSIMHIRARK